MLVNKLLLTLILTTYSFSIFGLDHSIKDEYLKKNFSIQQNYLESMGFENYADAARKTLGNSKGLTDVVSLALEKNSIEYLSLNSAKEIGAISYALLSIAYRDNKFQEVRHILEPIIMKNLSSIPLVSIDIQEIEYQNIILEDRYSKQKVILYERAQKRYKNDKEILIKAYLHIVNNILKLNFDRNELVNWLDEHISKNISKNYTNQTRQQSLYLGRSLVVSYVKFLREHKFKDIEEQFENYLENNYITLNNFITSSYTHKFKEKKEITIKMKNGDFAYEYSHGDEPFFTSLVVRPSEKNDSELANKYNLLSNLTHSLKFLNNDTYYNAIDKINTNLEPSAEELKVYENYWNINYAKGFSHAGIVEVKEDAEYKIAIAWIWDIFPDTDKIGTIRLMNAESFGDSNKHLKFAISRNSPLKLLNVYKEQLTQVGYKENIWESNSSFVGKYINSDKSGPAIDDSEQYIWKTHISREDYKSWTNIKEADASDWFNQIILPRVFHRIKEYIYTKDAKVFANGLLSARDMLYCSQMIVVAYLEATNIDIQPHHDSVPNFLLALNKKLKMFDSRGINHRIVSPNGLIWQSKLNMSLEVIEHDKNESQFNHLKRNDSNNYLKRYSNMLNYNEEINKIDLSEFDLYMLNPDYFEVVDYLN